MLKAGQTLLLNNRRWHIRQVRPARGRGLSLEAVGASEANLGMARQLAALLYGSHLFIARNRGRGYWYANLEQDWRGHSHNRALACVPASRLDLLDIHTRFPAAGDLPNRFSWSYSRDRLYRQCPRAYYYHYYAAWEGWQKDAPAPVQRAYLLKNLTDIPHWVGTLVHESIKFALARLKDGRPVSPAHLEARMHNRARTDFKDSLSGRYRQQPNRLTGFQEHYYRLDLPPTAWQTAWSTAAQTLRAFLRSPLYAYLRQQPPHTFLDVEQLRSFSLFGTKIWVQLDLARQEGETITVYDWKTGPVNQAEVRRQLGIYGLFFRHTRPAVLQGRVYALAEERLLEFTLDDAALEQSRAMVEAGIARLKELLLDPQANLAELRRFPMIDDLSVCGRCRFRELCGRDTR